MRKNAKRLVISSLMVLGGIGGLFSGDALYLGILLSLAGLLGGLWSYLSAEIDSEDVAQRMDSFALLFCRAGLGNVHMEAIKRELDRKGSCTDLESKLSKALLVDPSDIEALSLLTMTQTMALAHRYWQRERKVDGTFRVRTKAVRAMANKGARLAPRNSIFMDALGILADLDEDHEKARRYFRKSSRLRTDPYWRLLMATSWGQSGQHKNALAEMQSAIKNGAQGRIVEFYLARALVGVGAYKEAVAQLERAREWHGGGWRLEALRYLAESYHYLGHACRAGRLDFYLAVRLLPVAPRRSWRHVIEGAARILMCSLSWASKLGWKVVSRSRILRRLYLSSVGRVWSPNELESAVGASLMNAGKYQPAKDLLSAAVAINPYDQSSWHNLATAWACLDDIEAATEAYGSAISLDPSSPIAVHSRENLMRFSRRKNGEKIDIFNVSGR